MNVDTYGWIKISSMIVDVNNFITPVNIAFCIAYRKWSKKHCSCSWVPLNSWYQINTVVFGTELIKLHVQGARSRQTAKCRHSELGDLHVSWACALLLFYSNWSYCNVNYAPSIQTSVSPVVPTNNISICSRGWLISHQLPSRCQHLSLSMLLPS